MKDNWKKELARDFLALGSWVLFILVVVRILILPNKWPYLYHIIIAGVLILLVDLFLRGKADGYVSRALVVAYFTSLFYDNNLYSYFVGFAFIGLIASSWYVGNDWRKIGLGVLFGIIGIGLGFLVGGWIG